MPAATRVALVTGCSSGIGAATASRLARNGWLVYATARQLESLAPLAAEGCRTLTLDVADEASRQNAVERVLNEAGHIDALINNAGYSQSGAIEEVPLEAIRRQFETNVFGLVRMSQLVLPAMRSRRRGRIVNVGSMGGRLTFPGGGIYHATKYAIEAVSDALRFEVAGFGIDVVLIQPGLIRTAFPDTAAKSLEQAAHARGPYAAFTRQVARNTLDAYQRGSLARISGSPDAVAEVIEKVLTARRPKTRYRVSASAHLLMSLRAVTTDRIWDAFLRRTYAHPGTPSGRDPDPDPQS